jgi:hypothetical protein
MHPSIHSVPARFGTSFLTRWSAGGRSLTCWLVALAATLQISAQMTTTATDRGRVIDGAKRECIRQAEILMGAIVLLAISVGTFKREPST